MSFGMDQPLRRFDSVTVFGGATMDRIARSAGPAVMGASNPGHVRRIPGGVGLNIAMVLARVGIPTRLVTRVGSDPDGEAVIGAAKAAGIDTSTMRVSRTAITAGYHGTFDHRGDLIIGIADMNVIEEIGPADAAAAAHTGAGDFWVADANLSADTLDFLAEEARATGHPIAALTVSPVKAMRLEPLLDRLTFLFANRLEAAALLGRESSDKTFTSSRAAADLSQHAALQVVVTGGNGPLFAASGGEVRSFTPFRTDAVAVNGAGDSFAAGTIAAMAQGDALNDAIRYGLAAAALTVEHGGIAEAPFRPGVLSKRIAAGPKLAVS